MLLRAPLPAKPRIKSNTYHTHLWSPCLTSNVTYAHVHTHIHIPTHTCVYTHTHTHAHRANELIRRMVHQVPEGGSSGADKLHRNLRVELAYQGEKRRKAKVAVPFETVDGQPIDYDLQVWGSATETRSTSSRLFERK